jgi:hypothetical protein
MFLKSSGKDISKRGLEKMYLIVKASNREPIVGNPVITDTLFETLEEAMIFAENLSEKVEIVKIGAVENWSEEC